MTSGLTLQVTSRWIFRAPQLPKVACDVVDAVARIEPLAYAARQQDVDVSILMRYGHFDCSELTVGHVCEPFKQQRW